MKTQSTLITLSLTMAILSLAGCGEQSSPNQSVSSDRSTSTAAEPVTSAIEAAKPAVEKAATEVKEAASTAVADATARANALIDQAKKLVSETKYADALKIVQQLADMKLTPEQEKLVASLKEQIQKATTALSSTNAAEALGNLLKR
jgi:hypothetical protein